MLLLVEVVILLLEWLEVIFKQGHWCSKWCWCNYLRTAGLWNNVCVKILHSKALFFIPKLFDIPFISSSSLHVCVSSVISHFASALQNWVYLLTDYKHHSYTWNCFYGWYHVRLHNWWNQYWCFEVKDSCYGGGSLCLFLCFVTCCLKLLGALFCWDSDWE